MSTAVRSVLTAIGGFLRGFVGVASIRPHCTHTPSAAREALAAQASQRGRCC